MQNLFSDDQSSYFLIDPETDTPPPEFKKIFSIWQGKWKNGREAEGYPGWDEFDFTDFIGLHGMLIVSETNWDPFEIRYRIFGSEIANIIGEDLTGKISKPGEEGGFFYKADQDYLEKIKETQMLGMAKGTLEWMGQPYRQVTYFDFPMNKSGRTKPLGEPTLFLTACHLKNIDPKEHFERQYNFTRTVR